MMGQVGTVTMYRTQDTPVALLAWAEQMQVSQGQPLRIGLALKNRSQKRLYLDIVGPYGLVAEPHMPCKIEVWREDQLLPYRGHIIKRPALRDEDLTPVYPGCFAGLVFDLRDPGYGYQLSQGRYEVVLWYDSSVMRGTWIKAKHLWRGRTSKVKVPIEVI
jgi:hypothetical protein